MKLTPLLLLLLVAGCSRQPRFEFHTGLNGALLWRCDRNTGAVEFCTASEGGWPTSWRTIQPPETVERLLGHQVNDFRAE